MGNMVHTTVIFAQFSPQIFYMQTGLLILPAGRVRAVS